MAWPPFPFRKEDRVSSGPDAEPPIALTLSLSSEGPVFKPAPASADWLAHPCTYGAQADLAAFLAQLEEEGFAKYYDDELVLPWDDIYRLMDSDEHQASFPLLQLPAIVPWRPILD